MSIYRSIFEPDPLVLNYSDDQPRDENGRWTDTGGVAGGAEYTFDAGGFEDEPRMGFADFQRKQAIKEFVEVETYAGEMIDKALMSARQHVAFRSKRLVGAASYKEDGKGTATLLHLGSLRKGTGTKIIGAFKERFPRLIAKNVVPDASGFYTKMGFKQTKQDKDSNEWQWDRE